MKKAFSLLMLSLFGAMSQAQAEPNMIYIQAPFQECEEYSEEACNDGYRYFTVGTGPIVLIPNFGIGYRERISSQYGWDTSLSFSSIGYAHQLSANLVGHYYFTPSTYVGAGLLASGIVSNHGDSFATISPDFVIGTEFAKECGSKQFLEMHVAEPTLWMGKHSRVSYVPLVYVKYGFSF